MILANKIFRNKLISYRNDNLDTQMLFNYFYKSIFSFLKYFLRRKYFFFIFRLLKLNDFSLLFFMHKKSIIIYLIQPNTFMVMK
jgi:hypothetical protein